MHTKLLRISALFPMALLSSAAIAEDPTVDMSGLIYGHYGYDLTEDADGYNQFDIDRVYVTAKSKLGKGFSAQVTSDMGRLKNSDDTKTRAFLKYAYLESKLNDEFKLRFGMSITAWASQADKFVGARYISKSLSDKNKVLSTSDIGVQALGKHMDGMVKWQAGVVNGDGYGSPESSKTKAFQGRVTVDPMSGNDDIKLPIGAFISQDIMVADGEDGAQVIAAGMGVDTKVALVWGEYLMHNEGDASASGYSASVVGKIGKVANVLVRYDNFDPSTDAEDDATNTIITGVTKDIHAGISAALTYERATAEATPDVPSQGAFVRMQVGF
jgi:hypothetical protein